MKFEDEFEICSGGKEADGNYTLSWCPSAFAPQQLAVGCGKEHQVKVCRAPSDTLRVLTILRFFEPTSMADGNRLKFWVTTKT
jgi:hypothetical protein